MNPHEKTGFLAALAAVAREELGEARPGDEAAIKGVNVQRVRTTGEFETADDGAAAEDEALLARIAAGAVTPGEKADIDRRAAHDARFARGLSLFTPLSAGEQEALVDQLVAQVAAPEASRAPVVRGVVTLPWWRQWRLAFAGLATAGAAAWLLSTRAPDAGNRVASNSANVSESALPMLPGYQATPSGGIRAVRGGPEIPAADVQRLNPTSVLQVDLRPATDVVGAVAVRAFVTPLSADGAAVGPPEPVTVEAEFASGSGAARVLAPAARAFGARRGRWRLHLVVGRPDVLAASAASGAAETEARGDGWVRLAVDIDLVAGD